VALPPFVSSIVAFLRAGYPEGVPEHDYIPLLALLKRQLTEDEVTEVADELAATGDADSATAMRNAIRNITNEPASDKDIARVSALLAAAGWPLASPHESRSSI
jgi:hypothetical protein